MNRDEEQLNLLGVFHYIVGGLAVLCSGWPMVYAAIGLAMLFAPMTNSQGETPPRALGLIFTIVPLLVVALAWALAVAMVAAGNKLRGRRSHRFCMIVAGIECLFFPFGTVLGVFSIIVLARRSVRLTFAGGPMPLPPAAPGEAPPLAQVSDDSDEFHLDLLGIFHYVEAGIVAVVSIIMVLMYVGIGAAMLSGAFPDIPENERGVGVIFVIVGGVVLLVGWTLAALKYYAGRGLRARRWHTYCLVIAALECLSFPMGTVLGVFTIIVLSRPRVKALFGAVAPRTPAAR